MREPVGWTLATTLLAGSLLLVPLRPCAADVGPPQNPHFPKPVALTPNVTFWKQVYTEHGVGDFVLHDRDNLGVIYGVVRVPEKANQVRAEHLAKPEIERLRGKYREVLLRLADGASPEDLGAEGRQMAELWGCPCGPDNLRRAAENIRVQQGLRQKVDEGLQRAQKLLPQMVSILKKHDVPPELAALPLVESTFNPAAKSKAGAVGLWQFIKSTGKRYLTITRKRDDRRDPLRATEAAAHLLKNNYSTLGSWPLAIVAYNHGHAGIQAASEAVGSKAIEDILARYNGPRFGFASRNFYAEFLAALDVVHPLLGGQGKRLEAKGRRRGVQQASISHQPPASVVAPPAPVLTATPIDAAPVIEAPAPAPDAEAPAASDRTVPDPVVLPPPAVPLADSVETPVAPESALLSEPAATLDETPTTPEFCAPAPAPSAEPTAAPPALLDGPSAQDAQAPQAGATEQRTVIPEAPGPPMAAASDVDSTAAPRADNEPLQDTPASKAEGPIPPDSGTF